MAHIFSDSDGNIGTIIVLKGHPTDYLDANEHTYHGDIEIPEGSMLEALEFSGGLLYESVSKLKVIKVKEAEARYEDCRVIVKEELHDALADGASDAELQVVKDKIATLKAQRTTTIDEINGHIIIDDIYNVDITVINHVGI